MLVLVEVILGKPQFDKSDCDFAFQLKAVLFSEAKGEPYREPSRYAAADTNTDTDTDT